MNCSPWHAGLRILTSVNTKALRLSQCRCNTPCHAKLARDPRAFGPADMTNRAAKISQDGFDVCGTDRSCSLSCMYDRHAIRLSILHMLPGVADRHGVSVASLLAGAGLTLRDEPWSDVIVTRAQICAILRDFSRKTGSPTIGTELAAAAEIPRLGLAGMALLSGRTVGECLATQAIHMPCLQSGVRIAVQRGRDTARWVHRLEDSDSEDAADLNEAVAAFTIRALRHLAGDNEIPMHVTLPHRAQTRASRYEDELGTAISFLPGSDLIISFDVDLLDKRSRMSPFQMDRPVLPLGEVPVDDIDCLLADDALHSALLCMIEAAALTRALSLPDAARTLGLSPRSLQRRLAQTGTTFETIVDNWRQEQALARLEDPSQTTGSIARMLGYSDPAHFVRAFHRWQGRTPGEYRIRTTGPNVA